MPSEGAPSERVDRLEELLERALTVPPDERHAFVARETSDDPSIATELAALILASEDAALYMEALRGELLGPDVSQALRSVEIRDGPDPWIGRAVGHYEIVERLGGGGMGVVYRAHDTRLNRTVALKFIAPQIRNAPKARERFLEEARAASALDHPNICTIHEIGETGDGRLFIVMPAYDGESLRSRIDRAPLPEGEAINITKQVARALAAAHSRGIVHRDIKPDNVFLTHDGIAKLLDFGLARSTDAVMSGPKTAAGTVAYMSPEQAAGEVVDARSDTWSLGVMLFEMIAGSRPFAAEGPAALLEKIVRDPVDFTKLPHDLAPASAIAVRRALAKHPDDRFLNGTDMLAALESLTASAVPPLPRRRWLKPRGVVARVSAIALVVSFAFVLTQLLRAGEDDRTSKVGAVGPVTRLLWVDDNPENNAAITAQLERSGIPVEIALNTEEGVHTFHPDRHQLVVSDLGRFEGPNEAYVDRAGLDLLARLRARSPDVKVIFCTTSRARVTYEAEVMAAGAYAIVDDCTAVLRAAGL